MITRALYKAIRLGEVYFDEPVNHAGLDIIRFNQAAAPVRRSAFEEFHTRLVDLTEPEAALFAAFKKDTRTDIRRAERESAICETWENPDSEILSQFFRVYDRWANGQNFPAANRPRLRACAESGQLLLSRAQAGGIASVWHAYYSAGTRARLLHSVSGGAEEDASARKVTGRLNRFLHWNDICFFKTKGLLVYDLGGWYNGSDDKKKLAINAFKAEFGGVVAREYNCLLAVSALGRLLCFLRSLLRRTNLRSGGL